MLAKGKPQIPDGKRRRCPQCQVDTWSDSRWCWNCRFDFDKAAMRRWHPSKLLGLSLVVNVLLALAVVLLLQG